MMTDLELAQRTRELEARIEQATTEIVSTLEKRVAAGAITASEAADLFQQFSDKLKAISRPIAATH